MFTETLQLQRLFVFVCMDKTGASAPYINNKLSSLYFRCLSGDCTHKIIYICHVNRKVSYELTSLLWFIIILLFP